jgi:ligand-binding sensor domain-containing protein/serine phosphatase RsbU (regulator of sigma subunit)
MKKAYHLILLISLMLITPAVIAQTPFLKHHGLFKGKEEYNVNIIYQDPKGWIWFGTDRGLFRFDGVNNILFTTADSLASDNITSLHLTSNEILWIGHKNGEITLYDGNSFHPFIPEEGLGEIPVSDILSDSNGVVWFSTLGEGVFRWDGKYLSNLNTDDGISDDYVYDLELDKDGVLWFATDNGITRYFNRNCELISTKDGLVDNIVRIIKASPDGRLWIGTDEKGITVYNPDSKTFINIEGWNFGPVTGLTINREDEVWISTEEHGIIQFSLGDFLFSFRRIKVTQGMEPVRINSVIKDIEENIWIGGKSFVTQVLPPIFEILNTSTGTPFEIINSLILDDTDNLWVCSEKGLYRGVPDNSGDFIWSNLNDRLKVGKTNFISLYIDPAGQVWAGTYGEGVYRINPSDLSYTRFTNRDGLRDNNVISISGRNNLIWFSTLGGGVSCFNTENSKFHNYNDSELNGSYVYETISDNTGKIWVAGSLKFPSYIYNDSLYQISYTDQRILQFYSVALDTSGIPWFNTGDKGILRVDGDSVKLLGKEDGIGFDKIQAIEFDKMNNLLIISNRGLLFYKPESGVILEFGENSWLSYQYPALNSVFTDKDGKIWIGTETGIIKYNPDYLQFVGKNPQVFLSVKNLFYDPILQVRKKFRYRDNNFTFGYTGIWFSNPDGLRYRYMLKGNDLNWTYSNRNQTLTYSNLPPGKYSFISEVSLDERNWFSSSDSIYSFTISPPIWRRIWFIIGMIVLFFLAIYFYIRLRVKTLERDKKLLEEEVQKRTEEIRKQNRVLEDQKAEIEKQRDLAQEQRNKIEAQKEEIQSSIHYARRIQSATLLPKKKLEAILKEYFILSKPCEIVSGDFYWVAKGNSHIFFAVADCTGHGVPGSFMSMLGLSALNDIVKSLTKVNASVILDQLNERVQEALHQGEGREMETHEGMDISLCILELKTNLLQFAGARNPMYFVRNNILTEIPADRIDIGSHSTEMQEFTNQELKCEQGDLIYLFSDGFVDQFGGADRKKYKSQKFKDFLLSIHNESLEMQKLLLDREIETWRGNFQQIDDILVMGIKIPRVGQV